ncbi:MAG: carbohydrate-binding family 9-like protein [Armatimonadetes bacterium]|nr:carbohydrate-binding family 9-like protein [Armatimonadota bacterium]
MTNKNLPYVCNYTARPITVSGRLDNEAWRSANPIDFRIPVTNEPPISKTEARMLWDDNYLYVGFKAYDKDIWSYLTERNAPTCKEDVLEIFFKTDPDLAPYFNFEINALGTVYDAFVLNRAAGGPDHHRWNQWDLEEMKVEVFIKGELNNPDVTDEYWQLEVAIPFDGLPTLKGRAPSPGDEWLFHLARYDYSIHLPEGVELSSTAVLSKVDFHRYEDWQRMVFDRNG